MNKSAATYWFFLGMFYPRLLLISYHPDLHSS
jgi:hypothetical protein